MDGDNLPYTRQYNRMHKSTNKGWLNTKNWNDHPKYAAKLKNDFETTKRRFIGLCPYCCCNTAYLTIYCW